MSKGLIRVHCLVPGGWETERLLAPIIYWMQRSRFFTSVPKRSIREKSILKNLPPWSEERQRRHCSYKLQQRLVRSRQRNSVTHSWGQHRFSNMRNEYDLDLFCFLHNEHAICAGRLVISHQQLAIINILQLASNKEFMHSRSAEKGCSKYWAQWQEWHRHAKKPATIIRQLRRHYATQITASHLYGQSRS